MQHHHHTLINTAHLGTVITLLHSMSKGIKMHKTFWSEILKKTDYLEDLVILKWRNWVEKCGLGSCGSDKQEVAGSCKHSNTS